MATLVRRTKRGLRALRVSSAASNTSGGLEERGDYTGAKGYRGEPAGDSTAAKLFVCQWAAMKEKNLKFER